VRVAVPFGGFTVRTRACRATAAALCSGSPDQWSGARVASGGETEGGGGRAAPDHRVLERGGVRVGCVVPGGTTAPREGLGGGQQPGAQGARQRERGAQ
jgi:hypothetical protein